MKLQLMVSPRMVTPNMTPNTGVKSISCDILEAEYLVRSQNHKAQMVEQRISP